MIHQIWRLISRLSCEWNEWGCCSLKNISCSVFFNARLVPHFWFHNKRQFDYESAVVAYVKQSGQSTRLVSHFSRMVDNRFSDMSIVRSYVLWSRLWSEIDFPLLFFHSSKVLEEKNNTFWQIQSISNSNPWKSPIIMQESWKFLLEPICETQEGDTEGKKNEKDSIKQSPGKQHKQYSNY